MVVQYQEAKMTKAEEAVDTPVVVGLVMNVAVAVALLTPPILQLI